MLLRIPAIILPLLFFECLATFAYAQPPSIDGVFNEWLPSNLIATDPVGDATKGFDLSNIWAYYDGKMLYVAFEIQNAFNLQNGKEADGTLRLEIKIAGKRANSEVTIRETIGIDFRQRKLVSNRRPSSWAHSQFCCLPTHAAKKFELQIDIRPGTDKVEWQSNNLTIAFSGSDSTDPAQVKVSKANAKPASFDFKYGEDVDFRIANLNTLQSGTSDPNRSQQIRRLIEAVNPTVICFQEEWDAKKFFKSVPKIFKGKMNMSWNGGCVVATSEELERLPMNLDRASAALVTAPNGKHVVVISAHYKCCGFAGSPEDKLRVQQSEQIVGEIQKMRGGAYGEKAKFAPVVLIGDYNLVGSRAPLDKLNSSGLNDIALNCPMDGSGYTWRSLRRDDSFWPGRLDLLSHTSGLNYQSGFVFDTEKIKARTRRKLGVQQNDSRASDHLLLVADFKFVEN